MKKAGRLTTLLPPRRAVVVPVAVDVLQLAVAVAIFRFDGDGVDLGQAQRTRGASRCRSEGVRPRGHVAFLQVVDELRFLLAAASRTASRMRALGTRPR